MLTKKQQKYQHYYQVKLDRYEYLTCKEMLPSNQSDMVEHTKLTYSPLGKDL